METKVAATRPAAVVTHEGGLKFVAQLREHRLTTDQPVAAGGANSAPTPLELIGAALGSCIALALAHFCNARAIPTAGLRVEVTQQTAKAPYRVGSYQVSVTLPDAFPPAYRETADRVARTCAVHNTLSHPPQIGIELQESLPAPF